jgi:hypothetical protein
MGFRPSYRSALRSVWVAPSRTSLVTPSSRMIRSTCTRKAGRGRLWQPHPAMPHRSNGWCTIPLTPPTSHVSSRGLSTHPSVRTSRWHKRLYLHHHMRYIYQHHLLWEPPPTPASTVAVLATLLESALLQRRILRRATPTLHHMANRRWSLPEVVASTTHPWRIFPRASKSSWVRFL